METCLYCSINYADCGDNLTIPNGFVNIDGGATTYNEKVSVQCDEGYELIGDAEITCLANGRWNVDGFCAVIGQYSKGMLLSKALTCMTIFLY